MATAVFTVGSRRLLSSLTAIILALLLPGLASARSPNWRGPGWYIVKALPSGSTIEDGTFPDAGTCNKELAIRINRLPPARRYENDADVCVQLAQDVDELAPAPLPSMPPAQPTPHFASLATKRVSVYSGPSTSEPVRWIYLRKGWPVEVISEQDGWRRIRDRGGDAGWVEAASLDNTRICVFTGKALEAIRSAPNRASAVVAWAEPNVLAIVHRCDLAWCEVNASGVRGFVERTRLWGLRPGEIIP